MTPALSVLDLAPVPAGGRSAASARLTIELAQLAERRGCVRYWFAEHHGMPDKTQVATTP